MAPFGAIVLDQLHTSYWILAVLVGGAILAGILSAVGFLDWLGNALSLVVRAIIRSAFRLWVRTLSWGNWLALFACACAVTAASLLLIRVGFAWPAIPAAAM